MYRNKSISNIAVEKTLKMWLRTCLLLVLMDSITSLTFYRVGIFSNCANLSSDELTKRHQDAQKYSSMLNLILEEDLKHPLESWYVIEKFTSDYYETLEQFVEEKIHGTIEYLSFDVCDDFERMTSLIVGLLLDAKYFTTTFSSTAEPMVFVVYTSLSNTMTSLVRDVFSSTPDVYVHYAEFDEGVNGTLSSPLLSYYTRDLLKTTVDSRLFEPPRGYEFSSNNREFE